MNTTNKRTMTGIIHVCGEHDTGKTTFALECGALPSKICFFDDDIKGRSTVADMSDAGIEFGKYVDLVGLSNGKKEIDYHKAVVAEIDAIKPGQFDAIVWDTWTSFANTCHPYITKYPDKFRDSWAPMGKIKGAQQWQEAKKYETALLNKLGTLAPTVIVITHLKDMYINDAKVPEKQVPASTSVLETVSRFRIWLRHNPSGRPVPIGLILKRLDRKIQTDNGLRTVSVLPRRLTPTIEEHSLWDTIWRYWDSPVGDRLPTNDETPDNFELSILDGTLTLDQRNMFQSMLSAGIVERDNQPLLASNITIDTDQILHRHSNGVAPAMIAAELGVPLPAVLATIRNGNGHEHATA